MGIQPHFDKFHNKIKLGREDDAYKKARDRDDSIKKEVISAFASAGYPVVSDFIQGSLKTHTGIVPISGDHDIDRALVIEADKAPDNPVEPKKKTLDVLDGRGFKNAKIKKPCVTADYASDNVHIDFIIYKRWGNQHYRVVSSFRIPKEAHDAYYVPLEARVAVLEGVVPIAMSGRCLTAFEWKSTSSGASPMRRVTRSLYSGVSMAAPGPKGRTNARRPNASNCRRSPACPLRRPSSRAGGAGRQGLRVAGIPPPAARTGPRRTPGAFPQT